MLELSTSDAVINEESRLNLHQLLADSVPSNDIVNSLSLLSGFFNKL